MKPENKKKKRTVARVLKAILALALVAVIALVAWIYLVPMVTADAVTVYEEYTVGQGDISTTKSFSATLSVKKSETFSVSEECTLREIYVTAGQEVKKGDPLVLLSTGDTLSANFDGVVNEMRFSAGDTVWRNATIVQICDLEHLTVSMNADEYDIEEMTVGQECTVTVISLGVDFDTTIAHINRVSQSAGSVAYYSVSCDLTVPENVLPGMQATVTIPSTAVQGVTTLDMAALAFDEDKNPYVLVKNSAGEYDRVIVETGLSDGMKVEIKSGLNVGDVVYAVAGTESVKASITLEDIYKRIVGETVVVNDMSSRGNRGSGSMPDMSSFPTDGTMPDMSGFSSDGTMPDMGDSSGASTAEDETSSADTSTDVSSSDGTATDMSGFPSDGTMPDMSDSSGASTATDAQSADTTAEAADTATDAAVEPQSSERPSRGDLPADFSGGEPPQRPDGASSSSGASEPASTDAQPANDSDEGGTQS